ncbi:Uncharacterized membrane protein YcaP, DUF421 family [Clostridium cavendishii DSM 21758]|uniref:Uncharacterized membrane protein YcaP, DUF421 family n=1 Tax=Clostridium cavendishii DSM 21758 TaxID=1121302 RepID=A0A1M6VCM9_9CLOT|nr:DUF421 domain-containing protein [Clostridium cavendishii]SHK79141.1 Uncharacterized membrane protein YcaP, DUF421 family [Clostridium cavendishii DSM 21758]
MLEEIIEIIFRSICTYIILLILGRIIGRKLISRITFYDFIVGVTIGAIAVRIALGSKESPILATISLIIITILVVITDHLDIKSIKFRKIVDGEPIIIINNGKLLDYNVRKAKITINKLMMQLREKDIFNIDDVLIAAIESDGQLTVLEKASKQAVTTSDLNISKPETGLITDIIIDGKIMYDNLKATNHDENWVIGQLKNNNISYVEDVFYAGVNLTGKLYVSTKTK